MGFLLVTYGSKTIGKLWQGHVVRCFYDQLKALIVPKCRREGPMLSVQAGTSG